jgi:hypothetical protein
MGKAVYQGSADLNSLNRPIPNFEQITAVLTSCYRPTFTTIALKGSLAKYGEAAVLLFASIFFTFCHNPLLKGAG